MRLIDIAKVEVNWMEKFSNDPSLEITLKAGCNLSPLDKFTYDEKDGVFFGEYEGEVHYVSHNRRDHNGFGGSVSVLKMQPDWSPVGWKDCKRSERDFGCPGRYRDVDCHYDAATHSVRLTGPWSSNVPTASSLFVPVMEVSVLESRYRHSLIQHPKRFARDQAAAKARGHRHYNGLKISTALTLEFAREVVDRLAPHFEIVEGNYGWVPKWRGMPPKNPLKRKPAISNKFLATEQLFVVDLV